MATMCISADLSEKIVSAEIHPDVFGSDHCPVNPFDPEAPYPPKLIALGA
jgi:hypothetical protein